MADVEVDRSEPAADLERARIDFHRVLATIGEDDWAARSHGTRWTNEQLLFHMLFGYMIVQRLIPLVRVVGRLPAPLRRGFARLLDAATTPFHAINYYGSCCAATYYNRRRMGAKFDRVIDALLRSLARMPEGEFRRGMNYPTRWDPYFHDYMTLADIYRYPGRHYDHHRRQLNIPGAPTT
ncbi:DinB family protein [Nocardia otitidiscaviarum]|uniref:DinB family protein n=1 Tax=Nocardia otitidiscaviarum TaxID=1823 RepID=UPI002453DD0C|nr:DinB family protein [Nocardia otitidiscaviarum]